MGNAGFAEDASTAFVVDFCGSAEGLAAQPRLRQITDAKVRRKIIELVKALVRRRLD